MNIDKLRDYWDKFHSALKDVGIEEGDIVYVASDISRIIVSAKKELEIKTKAEQFEFVDMLIDELKKHVGLDGTLLFPVYSWTFCKSGTFDYKKTQGEVGALNNYVLNNRNDFKRTYHPIYSFMVWGHDQQKLLDMRNQDSWGEGSPFSYLHKEGAKELDLSVELVRSLTFKHYVEQCVRVPYRHPKYFLSEYIDENGVSETRSYSMYVRDLSVKLESTQDIEYFISENVASKTQFMGWDIASVDFAKAYDVIREDLLERNGEHIYRFTDYKIDWSKESNVYEVKFLPDKELI